MPAFLFPVHVLQLKTDSAGMSKRVNILLILWVQNRLVSSQFYGPPSTSFTSMIFPFKFFV